MKPLRRLRRFVPLLLLPLACSLSQCGKKEDPASPKAAGGGTSPAAGAEAQKKAPSLADHAEKLGFAAKLPADTELYLGTAQLKKHLENIKKSTWWKDLSAMVGDKTPAPASGEKAQQLFLEAWGDDMFIAGAAGFSKDAELLRDLNRLYNEVYFKLLMTGGAAGLQGNPEAASNPMAMVQPLLTDQASLEKVGQFIAKFELPSIIAGVKTNKGPELIAEIFSEKSMKNKPPEIEISDFKTADGHTFKAITLELGKMITEEKQKQMLEGMAKMFPEPAQKTFEKALTDIRKKKFVFGIGVVDGHLLLATGKNLDYLKFAADPSKSLLANPGMAGLQQYAQKDLTGLVYATAATLSALHDDQPLVPMLRGAVGAMKENEMFKPMGEALEKDVAEVSTLERNVYARKFTDLAGVSWWEGGALNAEFFGGAPAHFMTLGKPLTFAGLVDRPGVVFGIAYHRNAEYEKAVRLWLEKLVGIAYSAAQQLVQAGIAGPQGGQQFAMFEMMLLPTIKEVYAADRRIDEKGLGSQFAAVLDVNGKMPSLPNVPLEDAKKMKFPRFTMVSDVANRSEIAAGWETINKTITSLAAIAGSFMGQGAEGAQPPPIPAPESVQANGMTTWYYKSDFFNGDLFPVSSINDKLLVMSTSKAAAESFAADLATPDTKAVEGCVWRLDLSALADFASEAVALSPEQTPEQIKETRQNLKWLQPFHALQGRIHQEKDQPRVSLKWELSDIVSFD